jgi:hypothetical protein
MGFGKDLVFEHMEGFITLMGGRAPLLLWAEEVEPWLTTQWQTEK